MCPGLCTLGPQRFWWRGHQENPHAYHLPRKLPNQFGNRFVLRVAFPLRGPREAPERKPTKNGEKLLNSPLRSDNRKWRKLQKNCYKNCIFGVFFPFLGAIFPTFGWSDRGGESSSFSPFLGDVRPGGFLGPLREKQLVRQIGQ